MPKTGPVVILVAPQMGENIGMVARAMANFGLSELRLVDPRDGWPNEKARVAASRATSVVEAAQVYGNLSEAIADLQFVYATTARQRDGFKAVRGPVEAGRALRNFSSAGLRTGILFGRERTGLENEEVALADEIVTFPVDPEHASLNIAQAVLLMSYEWMKAGLGDENATRFSGPDVLPAEKAELHSLLDYLEKGLDQRGYFRPRARKSRMFELLVAVFTRPGFTSGELKVLRGAFTSFDRFSPKMPRGEGSPGDDPRRLPAPDVPVVKAEDG